MKPEIIQLLQAHLIGNVSEEQQRALKEWLDSDEKNRQFFERFCSSQAFRWRYNQWRKINVKAAIRIFDVRTKGWSMRIRMMRICAAVAAVVFVALGGFWLKWHLQEPVAEIVTNAIVPGSAKAVLTLSDGRKVDLTDKDSLSMNLKSGAQLTNQDAQLVYQGGNTQEVVYNELWVPRGGEYDVELADGTKVALNSSSSLRYPEIFVGDERVVSLRGEAYFEVAKSAKPFWVKVGNMAVKVYGTSFNINTHVKGKVQTVLVEGKVGISVFGGEEYLLSSSQLAEFDLNKSTIKIRDVDLFPYIAWTKGELVFESERLETIMETLSLWYNMEVFYTNEQVKDLHFTGIVKRYEDIGVILNALEKSVHVKFERKGNVLIIN